MVNFWDQFSDSEVEQDQNQQINDLENPTIEESNELNWNDFDTPNTYTDKDPTKEESDLNFFSRNLISSIARIGETLVGKPGDITEGAMNIARYHPEATGLLGYGLYNMIGEDNWDKLFEGDPNEEMLQFKFPTSEDLKKLTNKVTQGYTEPKNKWEKRAQDLVSDVASTFTRRPTNRQEFLRNNLGIPAAANVVKDAVEDMHFGENKAEWAKSATWISLSLLNNVNARNYAINRIRAGRQGFGPNINADVPRLELSLDALERNLQGGDPRTALALQQISAIRNDLQSGRSSINDLMNRYDAINAVKSDRGMFALPTTQRQSAIRNINNVRNAIRDEINQIGAVNPDALANWNEGIRSLAVVHRSNALSNWVDRTLRGRYAKALSGPLAALFGAGTYAGYKAPFVGGSLTAVGAGGYKAGQVAYRVWQDPNLARYYWRAIAASQRGNEQAFLRSYRNLEKRYEKLYSPEASGRRLLKSV